MLTLAIAILHESASNMVQFLDGLYVSEKGNVVEEA